MKEYLQEIAKDELVTDHVEDDWSLTEELYENVGGDLEDAYQAGLADGRIELARSLLEKFFDDKGDE